MPKRIQMTRHKPWRSEHPDAVIVARPGRWGNFYRIGEPMCRKMMKAWGFDIRQFGSPDYVCADAEEAVRRFTAVIVNDGASMHMIRKALKGRDLACWCPPDQPCHADSLITLANRPVRCQSCSGRGYHPCGCWPGDCLCGWDDEECEDCGGTGFERDEDEEYECG